MKRILYLALSFALLNIVLGHSTKYHVERNETCYKPTPAKIYSWHFHILYWQTRDDHTKGAFDLKEKFYQAFKNQLGPSCQSLFHQDKMCIFEPDEEPVGPFSTAQWAVYFLPEDFGVVVPWIMQNRGIYDVLIHPNSGCELEDHSWWAVWGGTPWQINMDAFGHDHPFPWPTKSTSELLKSQETSQLTKQFLTEHEH